MIPVNEPLISKNAKKYVLDCLNSGWISSSGEYINKFEQEFAKYIGTKFAITTTSGTSALHLALASIDVSKGDEVIIPNLTIISCALAVLYLGATPVLVDVEELTGNIDSAKIESAITKRTKAIMVVHLYGHPANMDPILQITKKYKLFLVEDAAEAHGAEVKIMNNKGRYSWKKVGSIGDVSCFSFYSNKIVTTGEGGMILTNNKEIFKRATMLKDLAHFPGKRFYHKEVGYNFRMTNLQAALGLAQLEEIENYLKKKRWIADLYFEGFKNINFLETPKQESWAKSVCWMYAIRVKKTNAISRDQLCERLQRVGIDTRTFFVPLSDQPVLRKLNIHRNSFFPISKDLSRRGFYIPSGLAITKKQIREVINFFQKMAYEV